MKLTSPVIEMPDQETQATVKSEEAEVTARSSVLKKMSKASLPILLTALLITTIFQTVISQEKLSEEKKIKRDFIEKPPKPRMSITEAVRKYNLEPQNSTIPFLRACSDFAARRIRAEEPRTAPDGDCAFACRVFTTSDRSNAFEFCFDGNGEIVRVDQTTSLQL